MNLLIESSISSVPEMPGFFTHRRKLNPTPAGNWAAIPNSLYNKSFVEQKIHPDLNSLAEELSSSQGHEHELLDMTADKGDPYAEATGFVGLEPSTRGSRRQNEAHTRTQEFEPVAMESEFRPIGIPVLDSASDIITENSPNTERRKKDIHLPGATSSPSSSPISITASSSKNRWSIFGSNRARVHRNSDASNATSNVSRPRSQSSSSQPRSQSTSQRIAGAASRTPKSQYSTYNSTGSTLSYNLEKDGQLPSPHTFGIIPTPPQGPVAESADDNSYFGFRETPPPLPPLDHPAFRQASKNHISSASNHFPIQTSRDNVQDKFPRHSHSLPSLAHSGSSDTQCYDIKGAKKRHRSLREELSSNNKTNKKQHNRNDSVASSIGTRRYSAEYSAKKASSVGHEEDKQDECWEVQVSKEMVRLALDATSPFGKACGKNLAPGEVLGLGSPFLLQDTLTRNLKDTKPPPTAISSPKLIYKSSNVTAKPLRANIMSYASRKGKERESGTTPSHSRRGRTSSTPSMNRTPSPLPNIDTAPIAGASSLIVPLVSVISPTPDVSPVTPSRRPHHRSQPTMPTTSVLERPQSGKRKAEDADVGGDKTPPKDPKEQRATFAPDPRTHRTSSSSHAPSSYNRSKRVRLTQSFDTRSASRSNSHTGSPDHSPPNAKTTGSWSSRGSRGPKSVTSHGHVASSTSHHSQSNGDPQAQNHRPSSRRSLSQASIPLSALVSPHAPSVGRSGSYHMRDPRKPPPVQSTAWSLALPSQVQQGEPRWAWKGWVERGGSPLHAWLFFIGFILFPLWWGAAFIPVRRTRRLGGTDAEKGVVLDDPQLEHDAKSWRRRCRIMAGVSLITYIPFIVLVAVFA